MQSKPIKMWSMRVGEKPTIQPDTAHKEVMTPDISGGNTTDKTTCEDSAAKDTPSELSFPCKVRGCGRSFSTSRGLMIHLTAKHTDPVANNTATNETTDTKDNVRLSLPLLTNHCLLCDKSFNTSKGLSLHMTSKHPSNSTARGGKASTNTPNAQKVSTNQGTAKLAQKKTDAVSGKSAVASIARNSTEKGSLENQDTSVNGPDAAEDEFQCNTEGCQRKFGSRKGLNIHIHYKHSQLIQEDADSDTNSPLDDNQDDNDSDGSDTDDSLKSNSDCEEDDGSNVSGANQGKIKSVQKKSDAVSGKSSGPNTPSASTEKGWQNVLVKSSKESDSIGSDGGETSEGDSEDAEGKFLCGTEGCQRVFKSRKGLSIHTHRKHPKLTRKGNDSDTNSPLDTHQDEYNGDNSEYNIDSETNKESSSTDNSDVHSQSNDMKITHGQLCSDFKGSNASKTKIWKCPKCQEKFESFRNMALHIISAHPTNRIDEQEKSNNIVSDGEIHKLEEPETTDAVHPGQSEQDVESTIMGDTSPATSQANSEVESTSRTVLDFNLKDCKVILRDIFKNRPQVRDVGIQDRLPRPTNNYTDVNTTSGTQINDEASSRSDVLRPIDKYFNPTPHAQQEGHLSSSDIESHAELQDNSSTTPRTAPRQSCIEEYMFRSIAKPTNHELYICDSCGLSFPSKDPLKIHIFKYHLYKHTCNICSKVFFKYPMYVKHMSRHEKASKGTLSDKTRRGVKKFACKTCTMTFTTSTRLKYHEEIHKKRKYSCKHCGKNFSMKFWFEKHMQWESKVRSANPQRMGAKRTWLNIHWLPHMENMKSNVLENEMVTEGAITNIGPNQTHIASKPSDIGSKSEVVQESENVLQGSVAYDEFYCYCCMSKFTDKETLSHHIHKQHSCALRTRKNHLWCVPCSEKFPRRQIFNDHLKKFHPEMVEDYICRVCRLVSKCQDVMLTHMRDKHGSDEPKLCRKCRRCFISEDTFDMHKCSTFPWTYNCNKCRCNFLGVYLFREHYLKCQLNLVAKANICEVCEKVFPSLDKLKRHSSVHFLKKTFPCKLCDKSFTIRDNLRRHERLQHSEKEEIRRKFKCDHCSRRFHTLQDLIQHMATHTKEKTFQCPSCPAKFGYRSNLGRHKRVVHEGKSTLGRAPKMKVCNICSKEFKSVSELSTHKAIHSDARPYGCYVCPKTFRFHNSVYTHHVKLHPEIPWDVKKRKVLE